MDKFIYHGMILVACFILAAILFITPVLTGMYMKMKKAEVRIDKKLSELNDLQEELTKKRTGPSIDTTPKE